MYQIDRMFYALYDAKAKRFLDRRPSQSMEHWQADYDWHPRWVDDADRYFSNRFSDTESVTRVWRQYEFARTEHRPDLPKLTVRKLMPRVRIEDQGWLRAEITPVFRMIKRMQVKHGGVMSAALTKLDPSEQPIYAIKRKGKTQGLVKQVLPDTVLHEGMFMFLFNHEDIILAKIALGANIAYQYDLTPFHAC